MDAGVLSSAQMLRARADLASMEAELSDVLIARPRAAGTGFSC